MIAITHNLSKPKTDWNAQRREEPGKCAYPHPQSGPICRVSRKEVIQPHLPVRLPCYDFVPVTSPTLDAALLAVRRTASSITGSHDVTGGVYKTRERIHGSMLTCHY